MTLRKGQYQIGDIVMGAGTNIIVTSFNPQSYDLNAQDYQITRSDEMRFGVDSFKPTTIQMNLEVIYNWLLPPFQDTISNFWQDKPTVNDLADEWRANDVRTQWGQIKPLYYCGRDGIEKMIFGRPGQFTAEKVSEKSTVVKCTADFRRADTLVYGTTENVAQLGSNTSVNRTVGNAETWYRIVVNGPATNPAFLINGKTIQLNATIPSGQFVEISSYPWARRIVSNTGTNLRNTLSTTSTYLDKLKLPMGVVEAKVTSGATAYLAWRDAWSAIE